MSSNIEWTDETWNPVVGCTRASAGCDNCYAVKMTHRLGAMAEADIAAGRDPGKKKHYIGLTVLNRNGDRHFNGVVRCVPEALEIPLGWKKPRRVFVNSMSDLFHKDVPFDFIDRVFAVMALCPQHTFQVLTKRPERMAEYLAARSPLVWSVGPWPWPLPNVWLGTSCENQETADERIPHLLRCPAAVKFLSCEPLIGAVDLHDAFYRPRTGPEDPYKRRFTFPELGINWVIVGGESGSGARPCDIAWVRSIVEQCKAASVPVFVKQLGARPCATGGFLLEWAENLSWHLTHDEQTLLDQGRNLYPRLIDPKGGDMNEWPEDVSVRQWPEPRVRHV